MSNIREFPTSKSSLPKPDLHDAEFKNDVIFLSVTDEFGKTPLDTRELEKFAKDNKVNLNTLRWWSRLSEDEKNLVVTKNFSEWDLDENNRVVEVKTK